MKSKKITAWILFMAMLVTMMPNSLVLAAGDTTTPAPYPKIVTDVFSEMTNDISGVDKGTDLDLTGTTNDSMPIVNTAAGAEATLDGITGTVYHNKDSEINRMRRKQILTFVAKSQDGSSFINSSTSTGVAEKAVEIAYLDADRNPLEIKLDSENFEVIGSGDWSKAWIDLSQDVQQTDRTLESFLTQELDGINPKLLTAAQLFATGDMVSFMIYNVIRSDFAGYLRIKITDNNGNTTVQDYPIVADGQYPAVSISTSTYKNLVGANVESDPVTNVAENTFINEMDFVTVMEDTDENKTVNETDNIHKSYRWHSLDKAALQKALDWEDEEYKPEKIWAMGDISIDKIEISDLLVTSGIKSVKYSVANYGLKENVIPSSLEGTIELTYDPATKLCSAATPIVISGEGFNVLAITAIDNSGLKTTNRYYFYIDTTAPKAKFNLVELDKNVVSLFTVADVVTNRQQAIDMSASDDVTASVDVISGLEDATAGETEKNKMYQYRLLATKEGAAEGGNVPDGYTATVLDKEGNDLSGWKIWTGETETPVIDKEFDGIVQVRVQDRAGNWSPIVSTTSDGKETIITDNTNPVIDVKEYALNSNSDTTGNTVDEIINGTASDILVTTARVTEKTDGEIDNEVIHTTTGDVAPWINDSAVLEVKITDKDLANEIRSSGLNKGQINVKAEFNAENENKKIKIWNKNGVDKKNVDDSFNLTEDYIFGTETDKDLTFYIEYEGTGVVDITVSVKDQADVNDGDVFSSIYKTQLRVDKINPYIIYKGYDITDDAEKDLLKANNEKVDYEVRNMPWGPNSQVLEVVVKDDDVTPVQSKTKNIKFNSDKALDLYKISGDTFTKVKTYAAGNNNIVSLGDCEELANEKYESNVGYKFYLVYEGTGIAKVEFFADDSAKEPNVRDYPSVATAANAEPVNYDAMLRVDKINPEIKNAKLVETDADVEDKGWSLFSFNETNVDVNTRKQMKITFDVVDETTTTEQSGVNIQNEKISGVDLIDVYDKYVEKDKTHLYENKPTSYTTDNVNDQAVDPNIDYILLPVEAGSINGTGGTFTDAVSPSNEDIEALVNTYLDKAYNADGDKCEWKKASWKDGGIVVPDEFQGAIVLRTIDRVGNIDYSEPITFVAESVAPMIDFLQQEGFIYSQNNYGWSKRPYDYVEIRIKDDNVENVDAWLENVFVNVTDLEGNDISTKDTVKFAHKIHADDKTVEVDPTAYEYVSLADFAYEAAFGYDVIDKDGLVETLARDKDGYIHLGYVRVSESAKINITVFDKAKYNNADYSGNKLTATWTTRIDRTAPVIDVFELEKCDDDSFALLLRASDEESGLAPMWGDEDFTEVYNKYHKVGESFLYKWNDESDGYSDIYDKYTDEKGIINPGQYELPGLQYALLEEGDTIEDIEPWEFEIDPNGLADEKTAFSSEGYYRDGFEKTKVWHNYNSAITPVVSNDFDGYIVVRAIDRAGNITVMGYAPTLDVTADDAWKNETQFVNVKALDINGDVINKVEYYGNNGLLYPESAKRDITTEALSGEGAFIEVVEEGITKVIVKASKSYADEKNITLGESGLRNDIWEGNLVLGNPTATGYEDWKYQITDVKIDKTAPTFNFELKGDTATEKDKKLTETDVAVGPITINIVDANDPTPNKDVDTMSHIASGIKIIEWCAIPEGSEEEIWKNYEEDGGDVVATNFTGTIKIRVTDNAGNVTEKSRRINIDGVEALISISKSYETKCAHEPVEVKVTVSPNAEFSDVNRVWYTIDGGDEIELPLTGGTISIDKKDTHTIDVYAETKAGKIATKSTTVTIHYDDLEMPTIKDIKSGDWVVSNELTLVNNETDISNTVIWYSLNGAKWEVAHVENALNGKLIPGANTLRIQTKALQNGCGCESDVNTYVINYDDGMKVPTIQIDHDLTTRLHEGINIANVTNESRVVDITPNIGDSVADIKVVTYDLLFDNGGGLTNATRTGKSVANDGGSIILTDDGIYTIDNVRITTESGITYVKLDDGKFHDLRNYNESINDNIVTLTTKDTSETVELYSEVVAIVDKTAPVIDDYKWIELGGELSLFTVETSKLKNQKLGIKVTASDRNRNGSATHDGDGKLVEWTTPYLKSDNNTNSALLYYEYAIVEKGISEPTWEKLGWEWNGQEISSGEKAIVTKAVDGTILIKVTDLAGNSAIKSIPILAESTAPEISITSPYGWQKQDATVTIDVFDKGTSSEIDYVEYTLKKNGVKVDAMSGSTKKGEANPAKLTSRGGQISISNDGEYVLEVTAHDYAGNSGTQSVEVKVDRTAPTYSGSVSLSLYNVHNIAESNWNTIHDGWTYNHAVSLAGVTDATSGLKKVDVKFTNAKGETTSTTFGAHQTGAEFTASGKYELTLTDNAGNVRNIEFTIDETLENVINVVGVDEVGKLNIAVTDGDDMLTFYKKENSESKYTKMYNGITDQLVDGKTGVRYIYGQNDSGKKSNTLYVIVAPSTEYGISLMSLNLAPNRYLNIDAEGGNVTVKKIDEIFNPGINKNISVGSVVEINEDGVYSITTND